MEGGGNDAHFKTCTHTLADKYDNEQLDVMHVLAGPKTHPLRLRVEKGKKRNNTDVP